MLAGVVFALGCASTLSGKSVHDRHGMSRLWATDEGGIVFEASISPDYPLDSPAAESAREKWMRQWLDRQSMCLHGFEVIDRKRIGSAADNPYQHDLRYTLRCTGT
ncbi:MAG: hypothetical protein AB8G16_04265 [Gammaproteobacteria bacterium]